MPSVIVKAPLGCHIWQGATSPRGYPVRRMTGRVVQVRRLVYEQRRRPLQPGEKVRMGCGERLCVLDSHMIATR
jgi:hypothetical protein